MRMILGTKLQIDYMLNLESSGITKGCKRGDYKRLQKEQKSA